MNKDKDRVNVTVPEDAEDMYSWLLKYDSRFKGKSAAVLSFLVSEGAKAVYSNGLENITPLDEEVFNVLAEQSVGAIRKAVQE